MPCTPNAPTPGTWSGTERPITCWWSRPTSRAWSVRSISSLSGRVPLRHHTVERGHGCLEHRRVRTAPVPDTVDFPYAAQVVVVERHTTDLAGRPLRTKIAYAITSLGPAAA